MPTTSLFEYVSAPGAGGGQEVPLTPEELEFIAEHEPIQVVPHFTLSQPGNKLTCIEGDYGPFIANVPVSVPLYLAMALHRRGKCRIIPPDWMDKEHLRRIVDEERMIPQYFQPVPQYYIEISKLLLGDARGIFGRKTDLDEVQELLEELKSVRNSKILDGLRKVSGPITIKLNNLSATECNKIRMLFQCSLNVWQQISKNDKEWQEVRMTGSAPFTL